MKKLVAVAVAVLVVALLGTVVYAARPGCGPGGQVDVTAFRQFQKETLPLRDEMMAKRLELRNEYAKESPDQGLITKLRADITGLRTQIQAAAEKNGLPAWGGGPGAGKGRGRWAKGEGRWGCGGCGGGGCGQADDSPKQ
jgi:zinc resistance-associated protein